MNISCYSAAYLISVCGYFYVKMPYTSCRKDFPISIFRGFYQYFKWRWHLAILGILQVFHFWIRFLIFGFSDFSFIFRNLTSFRKLHKHIASRVYFLAFWAKCIYRNTCIIIHRRLLFRIPFSLGLVRILQAPGLWLANLVKCCPYYSAVTAVTSLQNCNSKLQLFVFGDL